MTVTGSPYDQEPFPDDLGGWDGPQATWAESFFSTLGYVGAIVTGPVVPLAVYLAGRNASGFVRVQSAQALNVALTFLCYAISGTIVGVLLSFDSRDAALALMVPVAVAFWLTMVVHLVRGASAAIYGEFRKLPAWICAPIVS
jgi:uncharacterized Tic20 family protein